MAKRKSEVTYSQNPGPCQSCEGSGNCPACHGRGEVRSIKMGKVGGAWTYGGQEVCPICRGAKRCPDCLGSGLAPVKRE